MTSGTSDAPTGSFLDSRQLGLSATAGILGGLIFGYSSGIIAGASGSIQRVFHTGALGLSIITTSLLVGGVLGAAISGPSSDRIGPRRHLAVGAVLVALGSIASGLAATDSIGMLCAYRFLVGVGVGMISVVSPTYVSEISKPGTRGAMVSAFQLLISLGILISYLTGWALTNMADGWRLMFALGLIPAVAQLLVIAGSTDTPSYLLKRGRDQQASHIVDRLEGPSNAPTTLAALHAERDGDKTEWNELWRPSNRRLLTVALALAIGQIVTGINVFMYYAPQIFKLAGFGSDSSALLATVIVGVVNVVATLIAVKYVDRFGRRPLLIIGLIGMAIGAGGLAITLGINPSGELSGLLSLAAVMVFVISFAMSMGPLVWVLIAEIFPSNLRSKGASLAIVANWSVNVIVSVSILSLLTSVGAGVSFGLFAALSLALLLFVIKCVPETKGKTLQQISAEFGSG